jgi:F0F1-type ATP synthase delta subunit
MKYSVPVYTRAFVEAMQGKHSVREKDVIVKNFAALIQKNGDARLFPKIIDAAAKMIREKEGIAKITFETARPLSTALRKRLHALAGAKDDVEEKVVPSLVAGVRVIRNDEEQFDMTLARRLQKLFV